MVFTTPGRSGATLRCGVAGAEACVSEGRQFPPLSNTEVPRRRYISWPLTLGFACGVHHRTSVTTLFRGRRCTFALTSPEVPRCRYLRPASSGSEPLPGPEAAAGTLAKRCISPCISVLPRCVATLRPGEAVQCRCGSRLMCSKRARFTKPSPSNSYVRKIHSFIYIFKK